MCHALTMHFSRTMQSCGTLFTLQNLLAPHNHIPFDIFRLHALQTADAVLTRQRVLSVLTAFVFGSFC